MLRQGIPQRRIARSEQAIFQRINVQLSGLVQHQAKTSPLGLLGHLIRRPPCIGWFHVNFDRHFDIGHGKAPLIDWKSGSPYDIAKLTVQVDMFVDLRRWRYGLRYIELDSKSKDLTKSEYIYQK